MDVRRDEARRVSAALFGNEKFVDVVTALVDAQGAVTAQHVARATGHNHSLVRDVLRRCTAAGVLRELPRTGGSRSPLYYEPVAGPRWSGVVALAEAVRAGVLSERSPR